MQSVRRHCDQRSCHSYWWWYCHLRPQKGKCHCLRHLTPNRRLLNHHWVCHYLHLQKDSPAHLRLITCRYHRHHKVYRCPHLPIKYHHLPRHWVSHCQYFRSDNHSPQHRIKYHLHPSHQPCRRMQNRWYCHYPWCFVWPFVWSLHHSKGCRRWTQSYLMHKYRCHLHKNDW